MTMPKGESARDVLGDDKLNEMKQSTHDHGTKFTNAGADGDKMVEEKLGYVGKGLNSDPKTSVNLKGG